MRTITLTIDDNQYSWLKDNHINISGLVRSLIDKYVVGEVDEERRSEGVCK